MNSDIKLCLDKEQVKGGEDIDGHQQNFSHDRFWGESKCKSTSRVERMPVATYRTTIMTDCGVNLSANPS